MICTYELTLRPALSEQPRLDWAYPLYANLLTKVPHTLGVWLHEQTAPPLSQFLRILPDGDILWTVNLFRENVTQALHLPLETATTFRLFGRETATLMVVNVEKHSALCADALMEKAVRPRVGLLFETPTAFKTAGTYNILPSTRLILQSALLKWNAIFTDCPIDCDSGGLEAMAEGLHCRSMALQSQNYAFKGATIPGFTGVLVLENKLSGFHRTLTNALLELTPYSGIGIKTTLGMGGVIIK
ncbi:MAG: CRISPR system precrRNA processing endoribonuclease RAMP protein Cas6 [Oscillospiraceae bacterium]